jgi:hypothetical protein
MMDNSMSSTNSSYCTPAQIYLVFAIIVMIVTCIKVKPTIVSVIIHSIYIIIWTVVLNYLCSIGHPGISWFLLFLPFLVIIGIIIAGIANKSHS